MDAFSAAKAKMGAKSGGEAAAAAVAAATGLAAPQLAAPAPSPAGPGSPAAPEPAAYKLEDLETLATVGECGKGRGGGTGEEQRSCPGACLRPCPAGGGRAALGGDTPTAGCPLPFPGALLFLPPPSPLQLLQSFLSPGAAAAGRCGPVLRRGREGGGWTVSR